METLLSPRPANLIRRAAVGIALAVVGFVAVFRLFDFQPDGIRPLVFSNLAAIDARLDRELRNFHGRSRTLFRKFSAGRLKSSDMEAREALITEKNGVITDYIGEVYSFKLDTIRVDDWRFIRKNRDIFYMRRLQPHLFHICFFMDSQSNFLLRGLRYPYSIAELKFFDVPLQEVSTVFDFDRAREKYFCTQALPASKNQLVLGLTFTADDIARHVKRKRDIALDLYLIALLLAIFLLCLRLKGGGFSRWIRAVPIIGIFLLLMRMAAVVNVRDVYLTLFGRPVHSNFQILLVLLLAAALLEIFGARTGHFAPAFLFFNLAATAALQFSDRILKGVNFDFSRFSFGIHYLCLLLVLLLLHFLPLFFSFRRTGRLSVSALAALLLLQGVWLWAYSRIIATGFVSYLLLSAVFFILLAGGSGVLPRLASLILVSASVTLLLYAYTLAERREFISGNLKTIFLSQNQYAKMVAREIVYEINSRQKPFHEYFREGSSAELESIWKNSLAARESIHSGIFVVSRNGETVNSFSSDMPFIKVPSENVFPFWHVDEVYADLFGKRLGLAVASINVFRNSDYIGYIMVQVQNSPDLILRSMDQSSIFTLSPKMQGAGLSYIKISNVNQILENPANINFENLSSILKYQDHWIAFDYMGMNYRGYIFKQDENTVVIFFPGNTVFRMISEFVKTLAFSLLLFLILNLRELGAADPKTYFNSFSIKVFVILIVISLVTGVVFSLFSLNFHFPSLERQLHQAIYEKGRIAQNIINNLIAESGEINQNHLFLLSKILDNEISVYENTTLLYTSNHRKLIQSMIPVYVPSSASLALNRNNQQFEIVRRERWLDLYFRISPNYIFDVEFSRDTTDMARARTYYVDFIITLFFILIFVGMAVALFFRNKIMAPIHELNRGMREVKRGNLLPLDDIPSDRELKNLYQGFNSMIEGIQEQKKNISEISRMKTLIQLGRRAAHEIKNPLTPIRLSAEQIEKAVRDKNGDSEGMIRKAVRFIIEETEHLRKVSYGFLDLSKLEDLTPDWFELSELIGQETRNLEPIYPHIRFVLVLPQPPVQVRADRIKIKQAIWNLMSNSIEAIEAKQASGGEGFPYSPEIRVELKDGEEEVEIVIRDNGKGIRKKDLDLIFQEPYSSKETGTGLGLIIVRRIVELHRGSLQIVSEENRGTTVFLRIVKHV